MPSPDKHHPPPPPPPNRHHPPPPPPPDRHHPLPPPPPPPPTTRLLRYSYKKAKHPKKVFRVFRSVFRSFPTSPGACMIPLNPIGRLPDGHSHGHRNANYVTGTLYGYRNTCVTLAIQENPKTPPMVILELELETDTLQTELSLGTVRIALECEKEPERFKVKLLEEPLWTMFFNGKKGGLGVKREATEFDLYVIELLRTVSMGAGVLPAKSGTVGSDGEIMYMRAHFDRVVGSKDLETLYMKSPDENNGPELSIFFVRM